MMPSYEKVNVTLRKSIVTAITISPVSISYFNFKILSSMGKQELQVQQGKIYKKFSEVKKGQTNKFFLPRK